MYFSKLLLRFSLNCRAKVPYKTTSMARNPNPGAALCVFMLSQYLKVQLLRYVVHSSSIYIQLFQRNSDRQHGWPDQFHSRINGLGAHRTS